MWIKVKANQTKRRAVELILLFLMQQKTLKDAGVQNVRFRLTVIVRKINFRNQNKRWKKCLQERFLILRTSREYTALQAKPNARILTLTDNAYVVRVKSGKIISSWI
jgi:hypothetical protein